MFKFPQVEIGDVVLWHMSGVRSPGARPAVVSQVNMAKDKNGDITHLSVCLNIMDPANYNMLIRDGVRHVDDPLVKAQASETHANGVWELTPQAIRLQALETRVEELESSFCKA